MDTAEVVIAGAGVIGLSLALDLAAHGLGVTVLERGRAMSESSWAAAGMLAAHDPENPPQLVELANASLSLYPEYLAHLEQFSRRKVPLRTKSAIQIVSGEAAPDLAHIDANARVLSPAEAQALEPSLQIHRERCVLLDESSLDPRDLCAALPAAAIAAGVKLLEETAVISIDAGPGGIVVQTPAAAVRANHFVNCAGAWAESPALGRLPLGHPRIAPAKGQMTTVRMRGPERLTHVLRAPEIYLVPRGDGRIAVGATVEHAGFDKAVEPRAIAALLQAAAKLWPPIADAEIVESWAGLRPGSADELPLIGPAAHPNVWVAGGHFRNGILLAPATARALSQLLRGEGPSVDLAPFAPSRASAAIGRPLDRLVPAASDKRSTAAL